MGALESLAGAHPSEQALIQRSIGAAVLDKLRGVNSSLVQAYRAQGGNDPTSVKAMTAVDQSFKGWNLSPAASVLAKHAGAGSFAAALQAWQIDHTELALIERAIGAALLDRLHGQASDLKGTYTSLGGSNPKTEQALQALAPLWSKVEPNGVTAELASV